MADYYPLIARAVAGLDKNTGDARRSLYERARNALVAQLRGVTPELSESDITRERLALEEAIRKVEAEAARKARSESGRDPAAKVRPPDASRWEAAGRWEDPAAPTGPVTPPPAPRRSSGTSLRSEPASRRNGRTNLGDARGHGAAGTLGNERQLNSEFDQPTMPDQPNEPAEVAPFPAPRPSRTRLSSGEHRSLLDTGLQDFHGVVSESDELGEASTRAARSARESYNAFPEHNAYAEHNSFADHPTFPTQPTDLDQHDVRMLEPQQLHPSLQDYDAETMLEPQAEVARPTPRGRAARMASDSYGEPAPRRSVRDFIHIGAALVLLLAVCGVFAWQWPNMAAFYHNLRAPTSSESAASRSSAQQSTSKFPDRVESGNQSQPQTTTATPNANSSGAAVAQRVVLYEEDPPNPEPKRYVGSAIWRTEMVSPGNGKPPELAVRADVEIPERGMTMTWSLRRNTDPSLPASHTVEIMFKLPKDFGPGGISGVPGMMMKEGEEARGIPIAGMAVKVTNAYFLIGLSAIEADKERNIKLLRDRPWFDIMLVYNNNRRAILAIEKGAPGEAVFQQAFDTWAKQSAQPKG